MARRAMNEGLEVALVLLKLTGAAADAFPPLKSAACGALFISDVVLKFSANKKDWVSLSDHVVAAIACVIESLPESKEPRADLHRSIEKLADVMFHIQQQVRSVQEGSNIKRAWAFVKDPEKIVAMRKELDDAIALFHLRAAIVTGLDVAKILEDVNMDQLLDRVTQTLSDSVVSALNVNAIPLAEGASWDPNPNSLCLPNTRVELLGEIMDWIESEDHGHEPQVLWLSSVAGGGKTAVANTVAKLCHEKGLLASSFFFDRKTAGRNDPKKLFSTLARGLIRYSPECAIRINAVIEADQSVATAPILRQFKELIHGPTQHYSGMRPITFVVDALDEGLATDLLQILRDEFPKLQKVVRFFVTSRPEPQLVSFLSNKPHIRHVSIDIHGHTNGEDIALYTARELHEVAIQRSLPVDWPGAELLKEFIAKAGGLFIWVSVVSRYLSRISYPQKKLAALLSQSKNRALTAEAQMDAIYCSILDSCDWEDEDFVEGYGLIMGAITAAKTPLSISALQSLHRGVQIEVGEILRPLGSLISSDLSDVSQPVELLHLSLQEFLSFRAQLSPLFTRFYLGHIEHSRRLAYLCITIMNADMKQDMPGTGFLREDTPESRLPGIPSAIGIPEILWYACQFWVEHLLDVEIPDKALVDELQTLLSTRLAPWLEILTSRGHFQSLERLRGWIDSSISKQSKSRIVFPESDAARLFHDLSDRLAYMDRREDALDAIEQAVKLRRQVALDSPDLAQSVSMLSNCLTQLGRREEALGADDEALALYSQLAIRSPTAFNPALALLLHNRSISLSDLGRREEALESIKHAVAMRRELAADCHETYNSDLAESLNYLSLCLSDLGHREDALDAIEQAVVLFRHLVVSCPVTYNPELANSLNKLASFLSDLGRREAALDAIEEALELYRQMVVDRPATYKPHLASTLNSLSTRLASLGRREEALDAIEEAVALRRDLAADRPAIYNHNMADSLGSLSNRLSDLGRREEALEAIAQAVALYRNLASDRPTTFNPGLAMALNSLSVQLSSLGHREEALEVAQQAVSLRRELAAERPATFNHNLANSLNNLSNKLFDLGRRDDALDAIEEAVVLYRKLAADRPATFNVDLAMSLNNLSLNLSLSGRTEEALQALKQALPLVRQLAADHPAKYLPYLSQVLDSFSTCLAGLGRREDALEAIDEAVKLQREMAAQHPAAFNLDLSKFLYSRCLCLTGLGHLEEAVETIKEAVALRRELAAERPALYTRDLVESLQLLSTCFSAIGCDEEAQNAKKEAGSLVAS